MTNTDLKQMCTDLLSAQCTKGVKKNRFYRHEDDLTKPFLPPIEFHFSN